MSILDTLGQLGGNLTTLASQLLGLGMHFALWIVWIGWWLFAVNWSKGWSVLAKGAWVPLLLLGILTSLVWSRIAPSECGCLGFVTVPNFWWQLGNVGLLIAIAFFCGWIQAIFHWAPAEINFDPPAESPGHGHDHGHGH